MEMETVTQTPLYSALVAYLLALAPVLLDVPAPAVQQAVHRPETSVIIGNFLVSSDYQSLYLGATLDGLVDIQFDFRELQLQYKICIAIVKSVEMLDPVRSIPSQTQIITLNTEEALSQSQSGSVGLASAVIPVLHRYTQQLYAPIIKQSTTTLAGESVSKKFLHIIFAICENGV